MGTTYSVVAADAANPASHSNATRFRTPFAGTARKFRFFSPFLFIRIPSFLSLFLFVVAPINSSSMPISDDL